MIFRIPCPTPAVLALLTATLCVSSGGVAAKEDQPANYRPFVTQPDRLAPSPRAPDALSWEDEGVDLRKYKAIGLERIRVALADESRAQPIDPTELSLLTRYFHDAIAKALGQDYPLVNRTGADVLHVRITIYDLKPTEVGMSVVTLVVPFAALPDLASGATGEGGLGASPYLGRTGIAVQFLDGASGKVVAEYVETRFGKKYSVDTQHGLGEAVSSGIGNYTKSFGQWDYAKQAFDAWAAQLRKRLDQIHGR